MILINLLPEEHRQKGGSPLKFLALVAVSATINGSLLAYWAWTFFGVAAEVNAELSVWKDNKATLDPQVAYHQELEAESKNFESRESTLEDIRNKRVSWTQELDTLFDVVNEGGDNSDKYLIWLDDLTVDVKQNQRQGVYGQMSATAHSGTANFAHVANFLEDLETSRLSNNFSKPAPTTGSVSMKDEGLMPADVWNFPLEMGLKAPEERVKQ